MQMRFVDFFLIPYFNRSVYLLIRTLICNFRDSLYTSFIDITIIVDRFMGIGKRNEMTNYRISDSSGQKSAVFLFISFHVLARSSIML